MKRRSRSSRYQIISTSLGNYFYNRWDRDSALHSTVKSVFQKSQVDFKATFAPYSGTFGNKIPNIMTVQSTCRAVPLESYMRLRK